MASTSSASAEKCSFTVERFKEIREFKELKEFREFKEDGMVCEIGEVGR